MKYKIGFIGFGRMGEALTKSILNNELASTETIIVSDPSDERLALAQKNYQINTTKDNLKVIDASDIIFLAIKPQTMDFVLESLKHDLSTDKMVISIAAGITLEAIESKIQARVIRVMPNTPCLVGEMAAGYTLGKNTTSDDKETVSKILNSAGIAFELSEELLDSVTGLSGSGPAFIANIIESLKEAGIKNNLPEDIALKLSIQTVFGTAKLLKETKMPPSRLIDIVSSPGGTTVAGRKVLEASDIKEILINTVDAATKRSKELGKK